MSSFFELTKCLLKSMIRSQNPSKASRIGIIVASIYLVLFFGFMVVLVSTGLSNAFITEGMETEFLSIIFAITQVIIAILCVAFMVSTLYFGSDNELLCTLPIKPTTIFWSKMSIIFMFALILSSLIILCAGIPFGVISGQVFGYYVCLIFACLVTPIISMFVSSLLLLIVVPLVDKLRQYRILMSISLIFIITLLLYFYFQFFTSNLFVLEETIILSQKAIEIISSISNVIFFDTFLAELILGRGTIINVVILMVLYMSLFALICLVCKYFYTKGVQKSLETRQSSATSKLPLGDNPVKTLLKREVLNVTRYTSLVVYCSANFILPPIIILFYANMMDLSFDPMILSIILLASFVFLNGSLQFFALSSFTREGKSFAGLKALPIDYKKLSKVKLIFSSLVLGCCNILTLICCIISFDLPYWVFIFVGVNSLLFCFALCCYCIICDAKNPRLHWQSVTMALQNNINSLKVMALGLGLIMVIVGWLLLGIYVFGWNGLNLLLGVYIFVTICAVMFAISMYYLYNKKCAGLIERIEP